MPRMPYFLLLRNPYPYLSNVPTVVENLPSTGPTVELPTIALPTAENLLYHDPAATLPPTVENALDVLNNAVLKLRHCPEPTVKGANQFSCQAELMFTQKIDRQTHAAISAASPAPAQPVVSFSATFNSFNTGCSDPTAQEQVPSNLLPTSHPPTHPPRPLTFWDHQMGMKKKNTARSEGWRRGRM